MRSVVPAAVAAALFVPATAAAQLPAVPGQPTAPAPARPAPAPAAPAPAPAAPAEAKLSLVPERTLRDGRRRIVLAGGSWRVRGSLSTFVPGQRVVVRLYRGSRRLESRTVAIRQSRGGARGTFRVTFKARRTGRLRVLAIHKATPELAGVRSKSVRVRVLRARASAGSRGPVVRLLQAGLDRLHYVAPRSGVYDGATQRAVLAYRKVNGMRRTTSASADVIHRVARGAGAFKPRHPGAGRHLEADLSRQVLALIDGRRVVRTYHTSSGAPATPTVLGSFRVYSKTPGTNAKGMVHSVYFIRGYAVHGYPSVPTHPASHGCLRVPIANARGIFDWLQMGNRVIVYR